MKQYYESEVLFQLMERDGLNIPSSVPPYESEIKAYLINQVKQAYPKLTDYEAEWLLYNYTKHLPADFPISSVSNVTEAIFENVVPFAYQSAILKGQTLVNLSANKSVDYTVSEVFSYTRLFKLDTLYTLIYDVIANDNNAYIMVDNIKTELYHSEMATYYVDSSVGHHQMTFTYLGKYDSFNWWVEPSDSSIIIDNIIILEGDHTNQNIPYFDGMQSVEMPVLTTTGKNLFSCSLMMGLWDKTLNKPILDDKYFCTTDLIRVHPNTIVKVSGTAFNPEATGNVIFYDKDKKYLGDDVQVWTLNKAKIPSNAHYMAFHFGVRYLYDINGTVQIEIVDDVSSPTTTYEPYKTNILSTPSDLELRGIGDVQDTLDLLTGEKVERISKIVLDGSDDEEWEESYETSNCITFKMPINNCYYEDQWRNDGLKNDCGFEQVGWFYIYSDRVDKECYGVGDNNHIYIRVLKSRLNSVDVNGFKSFLSTNPITIQYVLATESIKTVDLTTVNENGETTHFMPLEGTMNVQSSGEIIQPTFDMTVPVEATTQNLASFIDLEMEE